MAMVQNHFGELIFKLGSEQARNMKQGLKWFCAHMGTEFLGSGLIGSNGLMGSGFICSNGLMGSEVTGQQS